MRFDNDDEPAQKNNKHPLNFGDVLYGSRYSSKSSKSESNNKELDRSAKLLFGSINLSHIEKSLLDTYPGVSKVLDDSQDSDPIDSFYYVNWEDPIYDQFDDFEDEPSNNNKKEKKKEEKSNKKKGKVYLNYKGLQSKGPRNSGTSGPKVEDPAKR